MEPVLIAAYRHMLVARRCSVDRILEYPDLRAEFPALVRQSLSDQSEGQILHELNNLRKRGVLPRRDDPVTSAA